MKLNKEKGKQLIYLLFICSMVLLLFLTSSLFLYPDANHKKVIVEQYTKPSEYIEDGFVIHTYVWIIRLDGYKESLEYENHVSYVQTNNVKKEFLLEQELIKAQDYKNKVEKKLK